MTDGVCSFTGHRSIEIAHRDRIGMLIYDAVETLYHKGYKIFMAGGALGFDTLCALAVLKFRESHPEVRLHLALPCMDQDKMWMPEDRARYDKILKAANEVYYVTSVYTDDCMRQRNRYLAENADCLVAYLGRSRSGAGQTCRFAKNKGIPIYNLYKTLASGGKVDFNIDDYE